MRAIESSAVVGTYLSEQYWSLTPHSQGLLMGKINIKNPVNSIDSKPISFAFEEFNESYIRHRQ